MAEFPTESSGCGKAWCWHTTLSPALKDFTLPSKDNSGEIRFFLGPRSWLFPIPTELGLRTIFHNKCCTEKFTFRVRDSTTHRWKKLATIPSQRYLFYQYAQSFMQTIHTIISLISFFNYRFRWFGSPQQQSLDLPKTCIAMTASSIQPVAVYQWA